MITRRGLLAGILAAGAAPVIVRSGILMPIRPSIITLAEYDEWWLQEMKRERLQRLVDMHLRILDDTMTARHGRVVQTLRFNLTYS